MDKKKMEKRIVIIIISILLALFIIHVVRNYIIINKITNAYEDFISTENRCYEMETSTNTPGLTAHHEYYYRGPKSKSVLEFRDENGNIVNEIYEWCDAEAEECIFTVPENKSASINDYGYESVSNWDLVLKYTANTFIYKLYNAVCSIISYDEVNGERCYKISRAFATKDNIYYFRISDGMMVELYNPGAIMEGDKVIADAQITIFKNFKIGSVTEEEMARPDLTGYNVTEHKKIPLDEYETYDDEDE